MNTITNAQRLWFYRGLTLLVTAILVHLLAVWAAPRAIMWVLMHGRVAQTMNMVNQAAFPPPVTAQSRSIVLPSPDMLYSVCVFDLRNGPVRISANPRLPGYWSIALYAANSDNFFVVNDRTAGNRPVDLWLVAPQGNGNGANVPAGSQVVVAPSSTGFLLMRVLTGDYESERSVVEPARRSLSCTPG
ncbi:MAG: hypothetical protein CFE44_00290 [Burkholderiales bacterium PBB4]|nr:MAG: hypothetical protein CFE44_00290 [Burkholderiales bacterium PBB4]